jgi:hypothetical protein
MDYFVIHQSMLQLFGHTRIDMTAAATPHWPVLTTLLPALDMPKLKIEVGPMSIRDTADYTTIDFKEHLSREDAKGRLNKLYSERSNLARAELADLVGEDTREIGEGYNVHYVDPENRREEDEEESMGKLRVGRDEARGDCEVAQQKC